MKEGGRGNTLSETLENTMKKDAARDDKTRHDECLKNKKTCVNVNRPKGPALEDVKALKENF